MAARSKYENLPGIDNQPDVFETPDVDNKKQNGLESNEDVADENVEILNIDTRKAYDSFKGRYLDPSASDFSDSIGLKHRKGYKAKTEYEILGESKEKETPDQKYQRLQHEMRELAEELEQIKGAALDEKEAKKLSPVALAQELHDLHLEKALGQKVLTGSSTPQTGLSQRLKTQLESFKSQDPSDSKSPKGKSDCVTYELFYKPEHAKFNQLSKMSELEKRIQTLEKILGNDPALVSSITADLEIKEKSILAVVSAVQSKVALLDLNHVEHIDARLQGILHHVSQISEKKDQVENAAKQSKINELYDLLSKWDCVVDVVPDVVSMPSSNAWINSSWSEFGQTLVQLDKAQYQVTSQLKTQEKLLKEARQLYIWFPTF
ncbi:hypothetical protein QZH41_014135 [Actinostola sp. cb2023]|nr:hypothetical protein QZH41_014135 [Actinostola sp. cb2023]